MDYWKKRQEQKVLAHERIIKDYYKELEKSFDNAKIKITNEINKFYIKYADANGVSFSTASKMLTRQEIGELKDFIDKSKAAIGTYSLELDNIYIKTRITRLEALNVQIDAILQNLYKVDYEKIGIETLNDIYEDSYYRTWSNIDIYKGFHSNFSYVSASAVEEIIKYPFNGANFSERIWRQKDHLLVKLKESLVLMTVQGKNPYNLSKDFAKIFDVKKYEAYRLLYTEAAFVSEEASQAMYAEDGVEKYEIIATLDTKTSSTCREQDGKKYLVSEKISGVNAPPFHMFCRTTTGPHYDDIDYSKDKRVARDEKGNIYEIPYGMDYKQWYDEFAINKKEFSSLIGIKTNNGISISSVSKHTIERAIERGVKPDEIMDTLKNPLKIGKYKESKNGKNQEFFGEKTRVHINPETGNIITVWKTGSKMLSKLKGG